jgi:DNA polymerase V
LADAVTAYITRAAEKLRQQDSLARGLMVYIRTNPFSEWQPKYERSITVPLPEPTAATRVLVKWGVKAVKMIYRSGYAYQKAGVMLSEICPRRSVQTALFEGAGNSVKSDSLMAVMDQINDRWGRGVIRVAAERRDHAWQMKRGHISSRFTTDWDGLPVVMAK